METRRFILALSLSLVVFLVYVRFFAPEPPVKAAGPEAPPRKEGARKDRKTGSAGAFPGAAAATD